VTKETSDLVDYLGCAIFSPIELDRLLTKAIQEQQTIIEDQKYKIDVLQMWVCSQNNAPVALCVN